MKRGMQIKRSRPESGGYPTGAAGQDARLARAQSSLTSRILEHLLQMRDSGIEYTRGRAPDSEIAWLRDQRELRPLSGALKRKFVDRIIADVGVRDLENADHEAVMRVGEELRANPNLAKFCEKFYSGPMQQTIAYAREIDADRSSGDRIQSLEAKIAAIESREGDVGPAVAADVHEHRHDLARSVLKNILKLARDWVGPSGVPVSANNFELLAMNAARFIAAAGIILRRAAPDGDQMSQEEANVLRHDVLRICADLVPEIAKVVARLDLYNALISGHLTDPAGFEKGWLACSFARLEIGHKLAAALCLTDVPSDIAVKAPWECWSLVVPSGLLDVEVNPGQWKRGEVFALDDDTFDESPIARIWCTGIEPALVVLANGMTRRFAGDIANGELGIGFSQTRAALQNLIRGACLALSNPNEFVKHKSALSVDGGGGSKNARKCGQPDFSQAKFLLSAPVKVDLRSRLSSALSGKDGSSPTVQFLVRGHWRSQPHGPQNALRKTIWIQPFWKGPEESRILLRHHQTESTQEPLGQ